ncbi:hypothetical protein [Nocardia miyunensis]|uniref:hypothetical protein n=1 Tax=Nocardia miyunensis TaxID=282684 RepID=UPI000ABD52BB|nr:hypothetical protein [Nocardia miyunensis]
MVNTRTNRRRVRIGCCVAAAVLAAVAGCGSQNSPSPGTGVRSAGQSNSLPDVLDCSFDKPAVRPQNLILACADLGVQVEKITWKSWTADKAEGDGTEHDNTCTPNCAAGNYVDKPVHVVLSDPAQPANLYTKATTIDSTGKASHFPLEEKR